jgi:hypothetical protein
VGREAGVDVSADLGMSVQAVYQAKYRVLRTVREELSGLLGFSEQEKTSDSR